MILVNINSKVKILIYILNIRNTSKNEALDAKHFAVFFLKVVCDASSKLILFGTWMLTYKCWNLSTNLIVAFYYGMVLLLILANLGFSTWIEKEQIVSLRNLIGIVFCN